MQFCGLGKFRGEDRRPPDKFHSLTKCPVLFENNISRAMPPPHKRRKVNAIAEITFDPTARHEYLTGFHKRKQERAQHARDAAAKRAKEEKVKERREVRLNIQSTHTR